jgi:GLPGLI family protein
MQTLSLRSLPLFIAGSLMACSGLAQHTLYGKIEYERKLNMHAVMKENSDDNDSWYDRMKSEVPQFTISYFDLSFDSARCIYKPGREVENSYKGYNGLGPAADNTVLTDFRANKVTAIKNVFEQKFLVGDSIRKIEWKEKDEIRTIADFKCHKAVGIICDSVYVVAFYTEDIPVSGGPEMFGGLPGMIMELAIPRLHTTWVADKIEQIIPDEKTFQLSSKGKVVTEKELSETIQSSLKDWGKWGTRYVWWTVL